MATLAGEVTAYDLNPRRLAALLVDAQIFVDICIHNDRPWKLKITKNALPADAKCVYASYDERTKMLRLVIWSQSFDEVEPDVQFPILPTPEVTSIYVEDPTWV